MAALAHESPAPAPERTLRWNAVPPRTDGRKRATVPAPAVDTTGYAPLPHDRLPMQKKVYLLSDMGLWPELEALSGRYGWYSAEVGAFIDAHLPKLTCPMCDTPFYAYSRRIKYCGDACRRAAAALGDGERFAAIRQGTPAPDAPPTAPPAPHAEDVGVWMERRGTEPADQRFYVLFVVRDLFGAVALIRQWGSDTTKYTQQVVTNFATLEQARAALDRYRAGNAKRGYRVTAVERGDGARFRQTYQAALSGERR